MKFTILIVLFWLNPDHDPGYQFKITHLNGKPLVFKTQSKCVDHIQENYTDLKAYVETFYGFRATISEALCVKNYNI